MKISGISPVSNKENYFKYNEQKNSNLPAGAPYEGAAASAYPKNYYISFEGRVDKGIERFYNQNKDFMPETMKEYLDEVNLKESSLTPLEAQQRAFEYLEICETVDDVKEMYPNEPLFDELKSSNETKSKRGLLYDVRVMQNDIEKSGETVVKSGEDLTVYLLKKFYLEGKTLDEINQDLDGDINPIFQREDKNYVLASTLGALGIKLPKPEYQTSLRYTREGYADKVGLQIQQAWENLSEEEKLRRITALSTNRGEISPEQREKLRQKRSEYMKKYWENLPADKRLSMIEKMQSGSDEQRIIMVNAWNKCPEIREAMSNALSEHNFYNPQNIIYREGVYSESMSAVMKDFWAKNPDYAQEIGDAIKMSYIDFDKAQEEGNYKEFVAQVFEEQKKAKAELKASRETAKNKIQTEKPEDKTPHEQFREFYLSAYPELPENLLDATYGIMMKIYTSKEIEYVLKKSDSKNAANDKRLEQIIKGHKDYKFTEDELDKIAAVTSTVHRTLKECTDGSSKEAQDFLLSTDLPYQIEAIRNVIKERPDYAKCSNEDGSKNYILKIDKSKIPTKDGLARVFASEYAKLAFARSPLNADRIKKN